jgi:hypothetical protein
MHALSIEIARLYTDLGEFTRNRGRFTLANLAKPIPISSAAPPSAILWLLKKPILTAKIAKNAKKIDAEPQILKRIARLGQDCSYSH